jgi:uncharacterized phosphosugar-binding protein
MKKYSDFILDNSLNEGFIKNLFGKIGSFLKGSKRSILDKISKMKDAEKEFIKDRQRYINIAINSDKRIQILMLVFIIDSHEEILAGQTGGIISLYKDFPKEIMLDLKAVNMSKDENVIKELPGL